MRDTSHVYLALNKAVPSFALSAPPTTATPPLLGPPPLSDEGGDDNLPPRRPVEPKSAPVTPKASPKVLPQVSDAPDESDNDLPYATDVIRVVVTDMES